MGLFRSAIASITESRGSRPVAGEASAGPGLRGDWRAARDAGRWPDALAAVDAALAEHPDAVAARVARADILKRWGREAEAAAEIRRAIPLAPTDVEILVQQAWVATREGHIDEAMACFDGVLASSPSDVRAMKGMASSLQATRRFDEAARWHARALERQPGDLETLLALGSCELARNRRKEAEEAFRQAISAAPESAAAHDRLGIALAASDRYDEAFASFVRADALARANGEDVDAYANRGIGLCEIGDAAGAVRTLVGGLRDRPNVNALLQLGPALLSMGRFRDGWRQYEHRWLVEPLASIRADFGVPQWRGQPLDGRTILVRCEQGLGDVFQFVRFLPLLKARGAWVLFQPLRNMERIAGRFPGIDHVVVEGERLPEFDYFVNLMSLPLALGTTVSTIPRQIPYLTPDPAYLAKWAPRLSDGRRPLVGLSWAGRPEHRKDHLRSLPLARLAPLLGVDGVRFVSLQKGPAAAQAEIVPDRLAWDAIGPELDELDDAAAVLAQLDLLICVDTGLAHLAGAMGKEVWVLLQSPSEYRWLAGRDDSPWYPTMRLFRQQRARQWEDVVSRVADSLSGWVSAGGRASPPLRSTDNTAPGASDAEDEASQCDGVPVTAETRSGLLLFAPDEPGIGPSLELCGEWMPAWLELVLRFTRPGATVVEVGAGAGAHTLPIARAVGAAGVVLAYDARPKFRRLLRQNLATHRLGNVSMMARAIGDGEFSVSDERIDDLRLERLDGLKVNAGTDVSSVLRGAGETLWRCRPWVMLGGDVAALDLAREVLRDCGYRAWRAESPIWGPGNFNRFPRDPFEGAKGLALFALPEELELSVPPAECTTWP